MAVQGPASPAGAVQAARERLAAARTGYAMPGPANATDCRLDVVIAQVDVLLAIALGGGTSSTEEEVR